MNRDFLKFALVSSLIASSISGCDTETEVIDTVLGSENSSETETTLPTEESETISTDENLSFHINGAEIISEIESSELSAEEEASLLYIREEEKLARDVYLALDGLWGDQVKNFANISKAEQTHTDSVKALLERYNLEDPVTEEEDLDLGVFQNDELQTIYNDLLEKGSISLIDALEVGATVEDLDIYDIELELEKIDNEDITEVYKNLIKGSENHMRAFVKALGNQGVDQYNVQYISVERYEEILAGETAHGDTNSTENNTTEEVSTVTETATNSDNGNGNSNGNGNNAGNGNSNGNGNNAGNGNSNGNGNQ
jgi:hypothetical protein